VITQQWACAGRLSPTTQGLALLGVDPTALHRISFLHEKKRRKHKASMLQLENNMAERA